MKYSALSEASDTCGGAPLQRRDREKRGVIGYKRQMENYQWLFRKNGIKVSNTGYFVYCNGNTDKEAFDGRLEFDVKIIPYEGNTAWVKNTILEAVDCLKSDNLPAPGSDCDFCKYRKAVREVVGQFGK